MAKDCAVCRTPILQGDYFFIEDFSKDNPFVAAQTSKDSAVATFIGSLRSMAGVVMWPSVEALGPQARRIIITDIQSVRAVDLVRALEPGTANILVHVFHTTNETKAFQTFDGCF